MRGLVGWIWLVLAGSGLVNRSITSVVLCLSQQTHYTCSLSSCVFCTYERTLSSNRVEAVHYTLRHITLRSCRGSGGVMCFCVCVCVCFICIFEYSCVCMCVSFVYLCVCFICVLVFVMCSSSLYIWVAHGFDFPRIGLCVGSGSQMLHIELNSVA